jgi:Protein of unknown function (DUF1579)
MCKPQQQFWLDVQFSALVHNFNNIFSIGHLYRAGRAMNSLPSQILHVVRHSPRHLKTFIIILNTNTMTLKKINGINVLKTFLSVMLIMIATFFMTPVFAQNDKDTTKSNSSSNGDDTFNQMLDYSRPGKYHQLLADLVGSWTFEGSHFDWVDSVTSKVAMKLSGTAVRRSFANGRFFIVDMTTGGKLQLPIQDGKMIEDYARGIQTEGYDNVKRKFQLSYINSHIGSEIWFFDGNYDSTTKTITFDSETELVPGMKTKSRSLFIFQDKNHYKLENYEEENGKFRKATEMNFTRVKGK